MRSSKIVLKHSKNHIIRNHDLAIRYNLPADPNGAEYPPSWNMKEPQIGPNKKPIPVAISINPIFYSLSLDLELETTIAIDATELIPDPNPPINYAKNDHIRNQVGLLKSLSIHRPTYCRNMNKSPKIIAFSRPI